MWPETSHSQISHPHTGSSPSFSLVHRLPPWHSGTPFKFEHRICRNQKTRRQSPRSGGSPRVLKKKEEFTLYKYIKKTEKTLWWTREVKWLLHGFSPTHYWPPLEPPDLSEDSDTDEGRLSDKRIQMKEFFQLSFFFWVNFFSNFLVFCRPFTYCSTLWHQVEAGIPLSCHVRPDVSWRQTDVSWRQTDVRPEFTWRSWRSSGKYNSLRFVWFTSTFVHLQGTVDLVKHWLSSDPR